MQSLEGDGTIQTMSLRRDQLLPLLAQLIRNRESTGIERDRNGVSPAPDRESHVAFSDEEKEDLLAAVMAVLERK